MISLDCIFLQLFSYVNIWGSHSQYAGEILGPLPLSILSLFLLYYVHQRAKKVVSDSLGLVDFAIGLVNSVFNLPDGQVRFF